MYHQRQATIDYCKHKDKMEYQKIMNWLGNKVTDPSKFRKKCFEIN